MAKKVEKNTQTLKKEMSKLKNFVTEENDGLTRLVNSVKEKNSENAEKLFNKCIEPLVIKWLEVRESEDDKLFDLPLMKQMSQMSSDKTVVGTAGSGSFARSAGVAGALSQDDVEDDVEAGRTSPCSDDAICS